MERSIPTRARGIYARTRRFFSREFLWGSKRFIMPAPFLSALGSVPKQLYPHGFALFSGTASCTL